MTWELVKSENSELGDTLLNLISSGRKVMTDKQFWLKLEGYAGRNDALFDVVRTINIAYSQNLNLICGCRHTAPTIVNQLYININDKEPNRENNRFMLCFTSLARGNADPLLPEPCEILPLRVVVDNVLNKPVIGGLFFNRNDEKKSFVVPKQLLAGSPDSYRTILSVLKQEPNPFNTPWENTDLK